jgi:DNA polymerase I-like protein with 3'-5' exonuclease and polymerase domains
MSGADGLNPQGIKHTSDVRSMFPLAWDGMVLSIGDFDAFEVTIADAVCNDEALRTDLLGGKKIHALFGQALFPEKTYDEIKASKDTENDLYTKGKQGFFGVILYGGTHQTLINKLNVSERNAKAAIDKFTSKYPGVKRWRDEIARSFCSMQQPGGIGSQVIWADPADYCETFLGFRRYFTLENKICRALFDLARKPPQEWKDCQIKVVRRDRVQTAGGAVSSALYGAAFGIQAAAMRAAANHQIQSPGAQITKAVQRHVWDLQPAGVHPFQVALMNVHDEIAAVTVPDMVQAVADRIKQRVESFKAQVPLIGISWKTHAGSWAEKK